MKTFLVAVIVLGLLVSLAGASFTAHAALNRYSRIVNASVTVELVTPGKCGDQNDDGIVNIWDTVFDLQVAEGKVEPSPVQKILSDLDGDGAITSQDADLGLQHIVGLMPSLEQCGQTNIVSEVQAKLTSNRELWESVEAEDYEYFFQWSCFCDPTFVAPVIISVRGDVINAVTFVDSGLPVDGSDFSRYRTVSGLFDFVQQAIDQDAHDISVEYDSEHGYPSAADIDYYAEVIDDEMAFTVTLLQLIPP